MQNGTLSRRERKRQSQKEQYLLAANRLFREKGFEKTSVEDISEAVDMGVGSFYYYFLSKEDLLANILLQRIKDLKRNYQQARDKSGSLREGVNKCGWLYVDFHGKYGPYMDIVSAVRQGHRKANIDQTTMEAIYRETWECVVVYKTIYEKYGTPGAWKEINLEDVSLASWALTIGVAYIKQQFLSSFPQLDIDRIMETATDMVLLGKD
ncbi:MAG: TetR/AcrR family transcriptional regulator [Bacillota bacterium]